MTIFQAIILGIIQGITEFVPVSSSGHLVFLPHLFGWADQGLVFDVVVHLGTLTAVVYYFRVRLVRIFRSFFAPPPQSEREENYRELGWIIILSVIPAGIIGLIFGDFIEASLRSTTVVGVSLILWGVLLGIADKYASGRSRSIGVGDIGWRRALTIGCAQAIALIPGTSRSGITMTAGLTSGLSRVGAAEFSFLMGVPVIALAGGVKLLSILGSPIEMSYTPLFLGFLSSAVSGFFAISFFMRIIKKYTLMPFAIYRVSVGVVILLFL
jgi:undecaprenyl-diphosphatase